MSSSDEAALLLVLLQARMGAVAKVSRSLHCPCGAASADADMIVVSVELRSARTGRKTTLAEMVIANDGTGTATQGNYNGVAFRKGTARVQRSGRVRSYRRKSEHVWVLVRRMLEAMRY